MKFQWAFQKYHDMGIKHFQVFQVAETPREWSTTLNHYSCMKFNCSFSIIQLMFPLPLYIFTALNTSMAINLSSIKHTGYFKFFTKSIHADSLEIGMDTRLSKTKHWRISWPISMSIDITINNSGYKFVLWVVGVLCDWCVWIYALGIVSICVDIMYVHGVCYIWNKLAQRHIGRYQLSL